MPEKLKGKVRQTLALDQALQLEGLLYRKKGFLQLHWKKLGRTGPRRFARIEEEFCRRFALSMPGYRLEISRHFICVSPQKSVERLQHCEKTLSRLKSWPLFRFQEAGRFVAFFFRPQDFERYTKLHFGSKLPLLGLHINDDGFGHMIIRCSAHWKRTLAHELCHAGYGAYPMPLWLGEGLATAAEGPISMRRLSKSFWKPGLAFFLEGEGFGSTSERIREQAWAWAAAIAQTLRKEGELAKWLRKGQRYGNPDSEVTEKWAPLLRPLLREHFGLDVRIRPGLQEKASR